MKLPKPIRGQCGTCEWFEVWPGNPEPGTPLQGVCVVNPPSPLATPVAMRPSAIVDPARGPQQQLGMKVDGMSPPTNELRKCSLWRPVGMQPPFFDFIRPGIRKEVSDAIEQ